MKKHNVIHIFIIFFLFITIILFFHPFVDANPPQTSDDPPQCCECVCGTSSGGEGCKECPCQDQTGGSFLSLSEGNLGDSYEVLTIKRPSGSTLDLGLF